MRYMGFTLRYLNQFSILCHHERGVVEVAGEGGTTTITSSPGRATPKAVRMAASCPRSVPRAARFASSTALRSSSARYCRSTVCASSTAIRALLASPHVSDSSQNATSKRMPIRIPCRNCFARMWTVYQLLRRRLHHLHKDFFGNIDFAGASLKHFLLPAFLFLKQFHLA